MLKATPYAHIARVCLLSSAGLLVTLLLGRYGSITLPLYFSMLELFDLTAASAGAFTVRRIKTQLLTSSCIVLIHVFLEALLPDLPLALRLTLGAAIVLPSLLAANHKWQWGFSEMTVSVTVLLITSMYPVNRTYIFTRVTLTTLGISAAYAATCFLLPVRYDLSYLEHARERDRLLARWEDQLFASGPFSEREAGCLCGHHEQAAKCLRAMEKNAGANFHRHACAPSLPLWKRRQEQAELQIRAARLLCGGALTPEYSRAVRPLLQAAWTAPPGEGERKPPPMSAIALDHAQSQSDLEMAHTLFALLSVSVYDFTERMV